MVVKTIMDSPLVSVIMSVYKEPLEWVSQSIDSILNQTYSNLEFIIINDNPSDENLRKFLDSYQARDNRIVIIQNNENIGLTKSLNRGVKISKGKYIARMDADDISYLKRLEKQVEFMETNPEVIVCGSKVKVFGKKSFLIFDTFFEKDIDIRGQMLISSGFAHPSVLMRRAILIDNNIQYDESFKTAQDYKLWFDLSQLGRFANLKDKLLMYRISSTQISSSKKENQLSNRDKIRDLFKTQYLKNIKSSENSKFINIGKSYLFREQVYYDKSFKNIWYYWINNQTAATIKEKFIVSLSKVNQLKKKLLS